MNYSFEGNPKSRPEQNLSGASRKLTRDVLLQKTHEERRKRQVITTGIVFVNSIYIFIGTTSKTTKCRNAAITY